MSNLCNDCIKRNNKNLAISKKTDKANLLKIKKIKSQDMMPYSKDGKIIFEQFKAEDCTRYSHKFFCKWCKSVIEVSESSLKNNRSNGCGSCIGEHFFEGDIVRIPLKTKTNKTMNLIVDSYGFSILRKINKKIHASKGNRTYYADFGSSYDKESVHRTIMGAKEGEFVDHYDGDGLNCTISNMSIVSKQDNSRNLPLMKSNTSGLMGVGKKRKRWRAYITVSGNQINLGSYSSFF